MNDIASSANNANGIPSSALQAPVQNLKHSLTHALLCTQIKSRDNADFFNALEERCSGSSAVPVAN